MKSYQGCDNRRETTSVEVFHVYTASSRHTSNFGGTSNIHNFFPTIFFAFFINRCGRYCDIDDPKRLVPEIAHVFIGTILRLLSSGQQILVLKTVLNDKTCKYLSVLKTTISTEFVEFQRYWLSKN